MMKFDLRDPLSAIDPASCSYDEWLQLGMPMQHEGYSYEVSEECSRN
ncbi:PriCT-2 domain-containing protein, partial [Dialister hominis]